MVLKVRNIVPWAGHSFSVAPDDIVELPDAVAQGRAAAGLVEILDPQPSAPAGRVPGIDYRAEAPAPAPASAPSPSGVPKAPARA